jgi:hypothetical protein
VHLLCEAGLKCTSSIPFELIKKLTLQSHPKLLKTLALLPYFAHGGKFLTKKLKFLFFIPDRRRYSPFTVKIS